MMSRDESWRTLDATRPNTFLVKNVFRMGIWNFIPYSVRYVPFNVPCLPYNTEDTGDGVYGL